MAKPSFAGAFKAEVPEAPSVAIDPPTIERQGKKPKATTRTGMVGITTFIPPDLHTSLRHAAFDDRLSVQDIAAEAVAHWLAFREACRSRGITDPDAIRDTLAQSAKAISEA